MNKSRMDIRIIPLQPKSQGVTVLFVLHNCLYMTLKLVYFSFFIKIYIIYRKIKIKVGWLVLLLTMLVLLQLYMTLLYSYSLCTNKFFISSGFLGLCGTFDDKRQDLILPDGAVSKEKGHFPKKFAKAWR